ncbi:Hypothetical protein A7982_11488 [Minicystis rosea]|nr:Hypothetical protein A7982_11488 [Minicystis rosea]
MPDETTSFPDSIFMRHMVTLGSLRDVDARTTASARDCIDGDGRGGAS